jgi:hypothetical protein
MTSQIVTEDAGNGLPPLPSLQIERSSVQRWISGTISLALFVTILWKIRDFGFAKALATLPAKPHFWAAFATYYLALPTSEWLIFRRLWKLPSGGFAALLRKLISNEVLVGYSGELYFYSWARRHARLVAAPFGAVKDVSILSAVAGNLATLVMLAFAWPLLGAVAPQFHGNIIFASAGVIIGMSMVILLLRNRIFSLPSRDLWWIFGVHIGRLVLTTILSGVMWHIALPGVPLGWLVLLATLQLLVTRLPLIPSKDMVFASLAIFIIGHDGELAALIAVIAAAILAVHLVIGGFLVLADVLERRAT